MSSPKTIFNDPYFTKSISNWKFEMWHDSYLKDFDRDGYELCELESLYAVENGITTHLEQFNPALGHQAIAIKWIDKINHPDIYIDHSFIAIRFGFKGEARKQLEKYVTKISLLAKLLSIKPKCGADLSLDVIRDRKCHELVHVEKDCRNGDELFEWIKRVEEKIENCDWELMIRNSIEIDQDYNENLHSADTLSDIKAEFFGFPRTYDTLKVI